VKKGVMQMKKIFLSIILTFLMIFLINFNSYAETDEKLLSNEENISSETTKVQDEDTSIVDLKENDDVLTTNANIQEKAILNGLVLESGKYVYYENGKINSSFTGLYEQDNVKWYVIKGEVDFNYNGTYKDKTGTYLIEKNKVMVDFIGLKQLDDWRMVINGKIDYNYTGLAKNQYGTWYMKDGKISYDYTGVYKDATGDYVVQKSQVRTDLTGLVELDDWRMVIDGKVDYSYTGIGKNQNGMWYIENGKINYKYTGVFCDNTTAYVIIQNRVNNTFPKNVDRLVLLDDWRMFVNGKVNYTYTGLGKNENGIWYVKNGKITYDYTGTYYEGNNAYIIWKSKVCVTIEKNDKRLVMLDDWRMVINGKVDYNYTGLGENKNGIWYVENGKINYKFNGVYCDENFAYVILESKVSTKFEKSVNRLVLLDDWRMFINGKVDYNYTGLGENENGIWYMKNGSITYDYTDVYVDKTGAYIVEDSFVRTDITGLVSLDGKDDWRMVINGKVEYNYTGLGKNKFGTWYVENGEILYNYTDTYYEENLAYIIEKNRVYATVDKNFTGLIFINDDWKMAVNGKVDYDYTGLGKNENGTWYIENGKITYTYIAEYTDADGKVYSIVESKLRDLLSVPGYPSTMVVEEPIYSNGYISDSLSVSGWALSEEKNDKILIYVDGKYIGEATRENREDIWEQYSNNEYGGIESTPLPGFYYNLATAKLKVGTHRIKIVNVASDGKTIMQSREIEIKITSLTKSYGIDVSHYQGKIDWDAVKKSGVTFAILKIGEYWCNSKKVLFDEFFEANYAACKRLGIAIGGYFYSYAFNSEEATDEANVCLSLIKGKKFELPIFYDVEDKIIKNGLNNGATDKEQLTNASVTFCNMMLNAGHQAGIYASRDFILDNFIVSSIEKFSIWVAHWGVSQTNYPGKYDFWQYTSDGEVPGINGRVDLDWYFPKK